MTSVSGRLPRLELYRGPRDVTARPLRATRSGLACSASACQLCSWHPASSQASLPQPFSRCTAAAFSLPFRQFVCPPARPPARPPGCWIEPALSTPPPKPRPHCVFLVRLSVVQMQVSQYPVASTKYRMFINPTTNCLLVVKQALLWSRRPCSAYFALVQYRLS